MTGITLVFTKKVDGETKDAFGNPVPTTESITIDDCLIAPITEPVSAREEQAISQGRIQVRIHLPKTSDADVSDSDVEWGGKTFHLDKGMYLSLRTIRNIIHDERYIGNFYINKRTSKLSLLAGSTI